MPMNHWAKYEMTSSNTVSIIHHVFIIINTFLLFVTQKSCSTNIIQFVIKYNTTLFVYVHGSEVIITNQNRPQF